jgi:hypothetical protein
MLPDDRHAPRGLRGLLPGLGVGQPALGLGRKSSVQTPFALPCLATLATRLAPIGHLSAPIGTAPIGTYRF